MGLELEINKMCLIDRPFQSYNFPMEACVSEDVTTLQNRVEGYLRHFCPETGERPVQIGTLALEKKVWVITRLQLSRNFIGRLLCSREIVLDWCYVFYMDNVRQEVMLQHDYMSHSHWRSDLQTLKMDDFQLFLDVFSPKFMRTCTGMWTNGVFESYSGKDMQDIYSQTM